MKQFFIYTSLAVLFAAGLSVMATSAHADEKPLMRVCTALKGGNYDYTGGVIQSQVADSVDIEIVNTAGSTANIKNLNNGECDAAIVQSDAIYVYQKDQGEIQAENYGDLYNEYAHLLCGRDSGVSDLGDLNEKTKVLIGPSEGGSAVTWRGMVLADKEFGGDFYTKIPAVTSRPNKDGESKWTSNDLAAVKNGQYACLFYVGTPGNKFMSVDANKLGDDLVLVTVKDKDFDDVTVKTKKGDVSIWTPGEIPNTAYDKILPSGTMWGHKAVTTIKVRSQFYIANHFIDEFPDASGAIATSIPDVQKIINADKGLKLEK